MRNAGVQRVTSPMLREGAVVARSGGRRTRLHASNDSRNDNRSNRTAAKNGKRTSSNARNNVVRSNRAAVRNDSSVGNSSDSSNSVRARNGNSVGNNSASSSNNATTNRSKIRFAARANVKIAGSSSDSSRSTVARTRRPLAQQRQQQQQNRDWELRRQATAATATGTATSPAGERDRNRNDWDGRRDNDTTAIETGMAGVITTAMTTTGERNWRLEQQQRAQRYSQDWQRRQNYLHQRQRLARAATTFEPVALPAALSRTRASRSVAIATVAL